MSDDRVNPSLVREWLPNICPNGHRLRGGQMDVAWLPCTCYPKRAGHRTVMCRKCRAVWYSPPHTDGEKSATSWKPRPANLD
jgi:hypothetical protein